MKGKFSGIVVVVLLMVIFSCYDDQFQPTEKYSWVESSVSPNNSFTIYRFKIGSDGSLYAMGSGMVKTEFRRFASNNWEVIALVDEPVVIDFTVYKDAVYYSTYTTLKRAKGDVVEIILEADLARLEVFQNHLIITGTPIHLDGEEYTIISYNGENSFTPIDQGIQSHEMKNLNDKLFIGGHPLKVYDGASLVKTEYFGGYLNIDEQGSIYSCGTINTDTHVIIDKFVNNKYSNVGNSIKTTAIINDLEFKGQSIFICGFDVNKNVSESYFLNEQKQWTQIETFGHISDLITFQDKLFAATYDGPVLELVPE